MQLKDILYHPCSMDIIHFTVSGIRSYEDHTIYEATANSNVGACGRVKILLTVDRKGVIRFISLADDYEYDSGLQDFVEGVYYTSKIYARAAYYEQQLLLCKSNMDNKERVYKEAKARYVQVQTLIKDLKEELLKD